MQTLDNEQLLFFVQLYFVLHALVRKWSIEPFFEAFDTVENLGQNEIQ